MSSYLPQTSDILSYWLLFISALSLWNTLQVFLLPSLQLTSRIYSGSRATSQLTPLSARTFAAWTLTTAVVRFYAAYRLHEREWYALALWTFGVAGAHFGSEIAFGTVRVRSGALPSLCVAAGTTVWMGVRWGAYVG